jgi:CO dehydrogenase/acetyl-CoA synthase beta subunit
LDLVGQREWKILETKEQGIVMVWEPQEEEEEEEEEELHHPQQPMKILVSGYLLPPLALNFLPADAAAERQL